jgi:hypothetical protein
MHIYVPPRGNAQEPGAASVDPQPNSAILVMALNARHQYLRVNLHALLFMFLTYHLLFAERLTNH